MDRLTHDTRVALRSLRRSPLFTTAAILILAVGIGMAGAMYSVIDGVMLRSLPVRDQDRIVVLHARDRDGVDLALAGQDFEDLRRDSRLVQNIAGVYHAGAFVMPLTMDGRPVVLNEAIVTGNFFQLLGVRPVLGRLLRPADDTLGGLQSIVLSYGTWRRQFAGDTGVLGRHFRSPYETPPYKSGFTIIGVAPPGLDFPVGADFWSDAGYPDNWQMDVVGRLATGAAPGAARSEFLGLMQQLGRRQTVSVDVETADIHTLAAAITGEAKPVLIVVSAAVAFLLIISCVNVGNLLIVRGAMRSPELVLRRAIGGTSGDLARLLSLESTLLVVAGGMLGLVLAQVLETLLLALAPGELPRTDVVRLAGTPVTAISCIVAAGAALFAVVSWFVVNRWAASPRLSVDGRSGARTRQRRRLGHILVGAQTALALIMLVGAGLLVRTLYQLQRVQLGYRADRLSILTVAFPATTYDSLRKQVPLVDAFSRQIRAIPGVTAISPIIAPAFAGPQVWTDPWEAEGEAIARGHGPDIPIEVGGSEYFRTFGIPVLKGRGFLPTDRLDAPRVAVVSTAVAQRFWPGRDPIGKRIRVGASDPWRTVVGVAGDTHFRALRAATPMVYVPWQQYYWQGFVAIRTTVPLSAILPSVRRTLQQIDPRVTLWQARSMDEALDEQLAQPKLSTLLMSGFGVVALLLTAVGLYGVMAATVREQTRDIGVRMALGATPGQLRGDVLRRALAVVVAGALLGLVAALLMARLVQSLLFDVSPDDPVALAGACGVLLAVALLAAYLPARHASRIDPARALQVE